MGSRLTQRSSCVSSACEVPSKGTYSFQFLAMCDSYAGIDVKQEITFTVQDAAASEYRIHKDDQKLESMSPRGQDRGEGPSGYGPTGLCRVA